MARRDEFLKLRKAGLTLEAIGEKYDLSKERVRQILKEPLPPAKPVLERKGMLGVSDVAQLLGIHANTVRRWAEKGVLQVYRLGSRGDRRFRRQDIDAFLNGARNTRGGGPCPTVK